MAYQARAASPEGATQEYRGKVLRVFFTGEDGYAAVEVEDDAGKRSKLAGSLHDVVPGSIVEGTVRTVIHPRFGQQLQAVSIRATPPTDKNGAAIYLSGCPGITESAARKIVEAITEDLWTAIENASPRVAAVVGEERATKLAEWYGENRAMRDVRVQLANWGLNRRQVNEVAKQWRAEAVERIRANPWQLAEDIDGIGWRTADTIAQRMKKPMQCVERARAAALHFLAEEAQQGHTFCYEAELERDCVRMMGLRKGLVSDAIRALAVDRKVVLRVEESSTAVYRASLFLAETEIARMVGELLMPRHQDETIEGVPSAEDVAS